ncbi:MAG: hypothetical protein QW412_02795, partial [Candidatus Aenigmatarchaeota archaeon]
MELLTKKLKIKRVQNPYLVLASLFFVLLLGLFPRVYVFLGTKLEEIRIEKKLESLVKKGEVYLDKSVILGALADKKVFSVFKSEGGEYAFAEIEEASIKDYRFEGEVTLRLPNKDLFRGEVSDVFPDLILRDGTKLEGHLVETALTFLELENGKFVPIQVLDAKIENSRISSFFSAKIVSSGYLLAGFIEGGRIKQGYVLLSASFVPDKSKVLGRLLVEREDWRVSEKDVLSSKVAQDEEKDNLDSESGQAGERLTVQNL